MLLLNCPGRCQLIHNQLDSLSFSVIVFQDCWHFSPVVRFWVFPKEVLQSAFWKKQGSSSSSIFQNCNESLFLLLSDKRQEGARYHQTEKNFLVRYGYSINPWLELLPLRLDPRFVLCSCLFLDNLTSRYLRITIFLASIPSKELSSFMSAGIILSRN